ncbi:MAG: HD domain-containing protein [Methyloligellaceae bacterium]
MVQGKEFAGVKVPDSELCNAVTDYARHASEDFLFNHVMRSWAFAEIAGQEQGAVYDRELLYIAAVLHDLGLTDLAPVETRFEVEGADMARAFLSEKGMSDRKIDIVWDAIALHTSMAIPAAKGPEAGLCQLGTAIDVGYAPVEIIQEKLLSEILESLPRLNFKTAMVNALLKIYERNQVAAQTSHVVAAVCEKHVAGFHQHHFCTVLENAGFSE